MKASPLLFLLTLCTTTSLSQTQWLELIYPESGILGKAVLSYRNGNITYDIRTQPVVSRKLDISTSADNITEYNKRLRSFVTPYFTRKGYILTEVKSKRLVIKTLNIDDVNRFQAGKKYVYSAICADSVDIITTSNNRMTFMQYPEIRFRYVNR